MDPSVTPVDALELDLAPDYAGGHFCTSLHSRLKIFASCF